MKGTRFPEDKNVSLDSFSPLFTRSVSNPLFGRVNDEIAENEENKIPEEKDAHSHEDAHDLLVQFHDWPSWIHLIARN
jgi:hypothetical protein